MAIPAIAEPAFPALYDLPAAVGAPPYHAAAGKKDIRVFYHFIGFDQRFDHTSDLFHKAFRGIFPFLDAEQLFLPVRRHGGRLDLLWHHSNQRRSLLGGAQKFRFLIPAPFYKAFLHQLLDRCRPGGRRSDAFALDFFRELIRTGCFHGLQQSVLRKMPGRIRFTFVDLCFGKREYFTGFYFRKRCRFFLFAPYRTDSALNAFPSRPKNSFPFCCKRCASAVEDHGSLRIPMDFSDRGNQAGCNKPQDRLLTGRKPGQIFPWHGLCGDNGMVVGHLAAVNHLPRSYRQFFPDSINRCNLLYKPRNQGSHIICQIPAVCSGIRDQLLFIQALGIIQGLLSGETKDPVSIPLQAGQVIQGRWLFCFLLPFGLLYCCSTCPFTEICKPCGLRLFRKTLALCSHSIHADPYCEERLGFEGIYGCIPHHDHGQGRRHHSPDRQCLPIQA